MTARLLSASRDLPQVVAQQRDLREREATYVALVDVHCRPAAPEGFWRFCRRGRMPKAAQGFKLHLSATVLSATTLLARCAPYLDRRRVLYKAAPSLGDLGRLNSGLFAEVGQIGKFVTVYPDPDDVVEVAEALHALTEDLPAPDVPFDMRLCAGSSVFYRYGAFGTAPSDEGSVPADDRLVTPSGRVVADNRAFGAAVPEWVANPFPPPPEVVRSEMFSRFFAFEALSQRGKGGVYRALDTSATPFREVILKEGRRHGETDFDGRDGYWRVRREAEVLVELARLGLPTPAVVDRFELSGSFYLAMEKIEGVTLDDHLRRLGRKLSFAEFARIGGAVATLVADLHRAGWAWRDCKPPNLVLTPGGRVRSLDFEGACHLSARDETPWGSPGYRPTAWTDLWVDPQEDDLFALAATLFHLATGKPLASHTQHDDVLRLRRGFSRDIKRRIHNWLSWDGATRRTAAEFEDAFAAVASDLAA